MYVMHSTHCCHYVECIVQTANADTSKDRFSSTRLHHTATNVVSWQHSSVLGNHCVTSNSYHLRRPEKIYFLLVFLHKIIKVQFLTVSKIECIKHFK